MEGITDGILRQAHNRIFGGIDVYCLPFHKLTQSMSLLTREERDITPEENEGLNVLPQALTRDPEQLSAWLYYVSEGDIRRKRLLRRADHIESCIYINLGDLVSCHLGLETLGETEAQYTLHACMDHKAAAETADAALKAGDGAEACRIWTEEIVSRPENSPVDCFQRKTGGQPWEESTGEGAGGSFVGFHLL